MLITVIWFGSEFTLTLSANTRIIKSAFWISLLVRSIPIFSISSDVFSRNPAVSDKLTKYPSISRLTDTTSRVVPAISETIARFEPTMRLNIDDLPTFGLPTITVLIPSVTACPASNLFIKFSSFFFEVLSILINTSDCNSSISSSG